MKNPKVSVLMPIYKTNKRYLCEAIESILNQTFTDFEFLILDDCPEDSREKIVQSYQDKRIRYIQNHKNIGITPSRNKLLKMAKGEYLAVMDHDDISLPQRFEKEVSYLDAHHEVGVVSCWHTRIISHERRVYPVTHNDIVKGIVCGGCYILHPASMIRKSVLLDNHLQYEEEYSPCEDFMLWARLIEYTKFHNIPEFLFKYRDHDKNTSHRQSKIMTTQTEKIINFMSKKYPKLTWRWIVYWPCQFFPLFRVKVKENKKEIRLFSFIPFLTLKNKKNNKVVVKFWSIPLFYFQQRRKNVSID